MDRLTQRVGLARRAASGLLDEAETMRALTMVDDRNDTVHTYNEALALDIAARLSGHATLLHAWLQRIEQRLENP